MKWNHYGYFLRSLQFTIFNLAWQKRLTLNCMPCRHEKKLLLSMLKFFEAMKSIENWKNGQSSSKNWAFDGPEKSFLSFGFISWTFSSSSSQFHFIINITEHPTEFFLHFLSKERRDDKALTFRGWAAKSLILAPPMLISKALFQRFFLCSHGKKINTTKRTRLTRTSWVCDAQKRCYHNNSTHHLINGRW